MSVLYRLLHVVNKIIPKKNIVLFNSFPAYSDNAAALYKYIISNRQDIVSKYKLVWGQDSEENIIRFGENNTYFVKKKSLKGFWTFLRARYVISTHGYFTGLRSVHKQTQINLWHGCGYKSTPEHIFHGDINIVTSDIFVDDAIEKFSSTIDCIKVTGYPRNDYLFHKTNHLSKLGIDRN
ncbi:MAG: CDP-glycerol glycerophosphotransferase family protein, partial [Porphyromonadaceae bacterium]|nr:CDP-glycerol glycerophosphotransferase family protein [Porphyromonadaceae bacterium]